MGNPLHAAVKNGAVAILRHAITYGHDVDVLDSDGATPLLRACARLGDGGPPIGKPQLYACIVALLEAGASVTASLAMPGAGGPLTPLHYLARCEDNGKMLEPLVDLLLRKGADVNAQTEEGDTPLHQACRFSRNVNVVAQLIDAGTDLSLLSYGIETPLGGTLRCMHRRADVYKIPLLIRAGAPFPHEYSDWDREHPYSTPAFLYIREVFQRGGFKAYEKHHADSLVALLKPKLPLLPELLRIVVFYWAHVGFYLPGRWDLTARLMAEGAGDDY